MCVIPFAINVVSLHQFNYLYSKYSYSIVIIVENNYIRMNRVRGRGQERGKYNLSCVSIFFFVLKEFQSMTSIFDDTLY